MAGQHADAAQQLFGDDHLKPGPKVPTSFQLGILPLLDDV